MRKQLQESPGVEEKAMFSARTALGRQLWEIRQRHIAEGGHLLSWDESDARLGDRRGPQGAS
jgi:hypothetical protein